MVNQQGPTIGQETPKARQGALREATASGRIGALGRHQLARHLIHHFKGPIKLGEFEDNSN
jgi:hypothetical protein